MSARIVIKYENTVYNLKEKHCKIGNGWDDACKKCAFDKHIGLCGTADCTRSATLYFKVVSVAKP